MERSKDRHVVPVRRVPRGRAHHAHDLTGLREAEDLLGDSDSRSSASGSATCSLLRPPQSEAVIATAGLEVDARETSPPLDTIGGVPLLTPVTQHGRSTSCSDHGGNDHGHEDALESDSEEFDESMEDMLTNAGSNESSYGDLPDLS